MPATSNTQRDGWRWLRDVIATLIYGSVFCGVSFTLIGKANDLHWALGLAATVCFAFATCFGIAFMRSREIHQIPIHQGFMTACLTASFAISVAASVSFQLLRAGWATFDPPPPPLEAKTAEEWWRYYNDAYANLTRYYIWVLLDMLPGLHAADLLGFDPPLKPKNAVAGIPVVAFRVFVLFGFLAALKAWWKSRKGAVQNN